MINTRFSTIISQQQPIPSSSKWQTSSSSSLSPSTSYRSTPINSCSSTSAPASTQTSPTHSNKSSHAHFSSAKANVKKKKKSSASTRSPSSSSSGLSSSTSTSYWTVHHSICNRIGFTCRQCKCPIAIHSSMIERDGRRIRLCYHPQCFSGDADPRSQSGSSFNEGRLPSASFQMHAPPTKYKTRR